MNPSSPLSAFELRTLIAERAWRIYSEGESVQSIPLSFYRIADMAIVEVHKNVDRMLVETIKGRLENLLPE